MAPPSRGQSYGTHQPSHHTRTLLLLFSLLYAAAPGVIPVPAAVLPWCWWWCPFLIILNADEFITTKMQLSPQGLDDADLGSVCPLPVQDSRAVCQQQQQQQQKCDAPKPPVSDEPATQGRTMPVTSSAPQKVDTPRRKRAQCIKHRATSLRHLEFYFERSTRENAGFRRRTWHRLNRTIKCRRTADMLLHNSIVLHGHVTNICIFFPPQK